MDESEGVRSLARYLLTDTLAAKAPLLAYNHFVEAMFVLNDCREGVHGPRVAATLGDAPAGGVAAQPFTLPGPANRCALAASAACGVTIAHAARCHGERMQNLP